MLKKPCLMTHIEHTFIEFEYTASSILKNVSYSMITNDKYKNF